jgi:hypothetical protein
MSTITINGISIDPSVPQHVLSSRFLNADDASASNYILIQTSEPLTPEEKKELGDNGVHILEYVPENTFLCSYMGTDLSAIRSLPFVNWANTYMEEFKISPSIRFDEIVPTNMNMAEVMSRPDKKFSRAPKVIDIVFHKNVDIEKARQEIATAAHMDPEDIKIGNSKIRIEVQKRYMQAIAAIDAVHHIEEVMPYKLHNDIARGILKAGIINSGTVFEGDGQIVAVADTGFDLGSTTDVHPAFTGRVLKLYPLGRHNKANDPDAHGTHVAGSILGDGTSAILGIRVSGSAPKAKLVFQSVLDPTGGLGGLPADLNDLFIEPYQNDGARIHSNSWGSVIGNSQYDSNSRDVDEFVWKNRDFIICFAAGNAGKDERGTGRISTGSITPPGTAKNCITVGATENNRPDFSLTYGDGWERDFPAEPIASDKVANNVDGMAAFSSRGPTRDHRIKPDVVAPGTFILSTLSRAVTAPNPGWGVSRDRLYFFEGGTSMATPLVAGCVAVVREYLIKKQQLPSPSAALVKAMIINGASDIRGQYTPSEADGIPNTSEGFGRVNLETTIGPFRKDQLFMVKDEGDALDTNEQEEITVNIPANAKFLKVTLVWTDLPGEKLQNDLDLIIKGSTGQEVHGNVDLLSPNFDRDNNVEQVMWPNIPAGACSIIVRAFRVVQEKQSYALVIRTES